MLPEEEALEKNLERNNNEPFHICGSNYSKLIGKINYTKWILYPTRKETYYPIRHRQIRKDEVVFDVDSGDIPKIADSIRAMLGLNSISYKDYLTGSKKCGRHIHCSFPELISYPKRIREILKKEILLYFSSHWKIYEENIDKLKVSDKCLIRLENTEHERTNVPKTLLHEYNHSNKKEFESVIPQKIIDEVLTSLTFKKKTVSFPTCREVPYWIYDLLKNPHPHYPNKFNVMRFLKFNMGLGTDGAFELIKKEHRWEKQKEPIEENKIKEQLKGIKHPLSWETIEKYNGKPKDN